MLEKRPMRTVILSTIVAVGCLLVAGCKSPPPELEPAEKDPAATPSATATAAPAARPTAAPAARPQQNDDAPPPGAAGKQKGDPLDGKFTLGDATKDLKGKGPIVAKIDTSKGVLQCKLFDDKAPVTVANFIGLATGKRTWKDPSGQWVNKPAYDGTAFHRVIKGFMIQGGDAKGTGSGEPGYVIKDEVWEGAKHDRPGLLCMANRGPNTNGGQFFITDGAAPHLTQMNTYTIFGECTPLEVIHAIASAPRPHAMSEKPEPLIPISKVTISRK